MSLNCDNMWDLYMNGDYNNNEIDNCEDVNCTENITPTCSDIYISTKTMICYLNKEINLKNTFWKLPIISYYIPKCGIIKKQIKYIFENEDELENINKLLQKEIVYDKISMGNSSKIVQKISIGVSKKDILSYRCKKKSAFYNCFVIILRIKYNDTFKECHVKIFNTGKIEIPGIQNDDMLIIILEKVVNILNETTNVNIDYIKDKYETVLINSNFNINYNIDREKLTEILKNKYRLNTNYDPCSYPGIMSKFYYDNTTNTQTGIKPQHNNINIISFMIFRTGSILIVGKCDEFMLNKIYLFIKNILFTQNNIYQKINDCKPKIAKKKKIRKKTIISNLNLI